MTLALVLGNAYIFVEGIELGNEVSRYEKEIKKLYAANMALENKVYALDSLQFAASVASRLEYAEGGEPIYLSGPNFARASEL